MADKPTFEFVIKGAGVTPSTLRLRELYEVLHAFETAISVTANQILGGPATDLHLAEITETKSAGCVLAVTPLGYQAATVCAKAIAARDLSPLPERARDGLLAMRNRARLREWTLQVFDSNGMPFAEIAPNTEFISDATVAGPSVLVGWIIRVGGTPRPTAHIGLPDFRRITAAIANEELAAKLGTMLYKSVTVEGEAKWATPDWRLVDFKITGLAGQNQDTESLSTLAQLAEIAGDFWDEIDPDEYVASLRSEEM